MQSRWTRLRWIVSLGILNALTPFSIDLYLPAFRQIAVELGTTTQRLSLTVSLYFVGYALGQLFYGPPLDRFGRKKPIFFGLALYLLGTVGCAMARSFEALALFRFVSALGGCAASVGAMSMVRDLFPAKDSPKIYSMLMLVLSASPMLAPTVGSLLVDSWGWRPLFACLAGLAALDVALVAFALPNAYAPDPTVELSLRPIFARFREIMRHPRFWTYAFANALSFSGLFVYVSSSPSIFMDYFGATPKQFGAIFAFLVSGMIGGGQINHLLLRRYSSAQVFRGALALQTVASLGFVASATLAPSFWMTIGFLFVTLSCAGVSSPNATALALEPFTRHIGSATSLLGFAQLSAGAAIASAVGLAEIPGATPVAAAMALSCLAAFAVLWLGSGAFVRTRPRAR